MKHAYFSRSQGLTWLAAWLLWLGPLVALAQTINVGPSRTYPTLRSAVLAGAVVSGTTVKIDDGTYTDVCRIQNLTNVTITSNSGRAGGVIFDGGSQDNLEDRKAMILVINSPGTAIIGIRFRNVGLGGEAGLAARGRGAGNQAGIRFEKFTTGTGRVSYCSFDNCVTGVFTETNDFNLDLTIDHCDFGREVSNGQARDGGSHDIYVNRIKSLTGIDNNFYGNPYGNNTKSRAWNTTISGGYNANYASRCLDLPNGGRYSVSGGIYARGAGENNQLFAYAEEYPSADDPQNNGLYSGTISGITLRVNNRVGVWNAGAGTTMAFTNVTYEWYGSGTATTSVIGPGAVTGLVASGTATAATLPAPPPAVSSSAAPPPPPTNLRPADSPASTVAGLSYQYYELTGMTKLPDFATLTPAASGTVSTFDLAPRKRNDDFAFRYTGYVRVPADGTYTFYTSSDDGSRLYIGSQLVVDNDGRHGTQERSGTIGLKAGLHAITVTFFEAYGGQVLSVSYAGGGLSKQVIPGSALVSAPVSAGGIVSGGVYRLLARHSNKALDVAYNSAESQATVWQHTVNGDGAQRWVLQLQSDGAYTLTHEGTSMCLDVQGNSADNGALVWQYTANGGDAQRWFIEPTTDGYVKLRHKGTDKVLDVLGGEDRLADGDRVGQWEYKGSRNQQWKLELLQNPAARTSATAARTPALAADGEAASLSVYPNPSFGKGTLAVTAKTPQTAQVYVHNLQGELVSSLSVPVHAGKTDFKLPGTLAPGTYLVKTRLDGQDLSFTLQVQ
ncbi:RICIN domain-containing protein [Hymenobacter weizhouensis]|uniref:RICIN domain-containing protein n=1 Tax=Hymenobacter sp. YIM 151500-1 TaxID=2987689 RepID=UPI0022261E99|nr:RICIN domain-containing protein [Hymenobacter sp. YIM 151500-1]UYZ64491.1 RICIN domain-containing protein [Hymenobacter sp. YIM 151500-1]